MNKGKIGWLVKYKQLNCFDEIYYNFPDRWAYDDNYIVIKIVYFEIEDDDED